MKIETAVPVDVAARRSADRPERPEGRRDRDESAQGVNYRALYKRVLNSGLDRQDKANLIERIKNAAAGGSDGGDRVRDRRDAAERPRPEAERVDGRRLIAEV